MEKRTVEKASCERGLFGNAQSLRQSSLRCGTRFVGAAEEPWSDGEGELSGNAARPSGNAQSLRQSSARCGTRFVGAAEGTGSAEALSEKGSDAQSRMTSDPSRNEGGTRFVGAAEGVRPGRMRRLAALCIAAVLVFSLAGLNGCSGAESSSTVSSSAAATADSESSAFEDVAAAFDVSALDLDYSKRDMDASYDEASATHVTLSGLSASVDGSGATVDGSTVTISSEGSYIISGELSSGQIVVDASDDAKIQLVLAGATIHNENGPAIYAKNAGKCFVTLADGTQNSLSDGSDYVLEDDSDDPYATLFCRCDLTINGTGALNVAANYRHGIRSKDDLVVTGGTLNVTAVEDCLRGRDCVKIADGSFSLVAGGDGIKSNKDTKAAQGFVSITGGTFAINAGDDAVQGKTYIGITGGTFGVTSADDAFHSDLQMAIAGGGFTVSAGDDAFHAETELAVDDGTINVASCYEGLEAEKVYVNGGDTSIVASDDAVNASAADLSDSSADYEEANDSGAPGEDGIAVNGKTPGEGGPASGGSPADGANFPGGDQGGLSGQVPQGSAQGQGEGQAQNGTPQGEAAQGDALRGDQGGMQGEGGPSQGAGSQGDAPQGGQGGSPQDAGNQVGAPGAGSSDCLIQINGGTLVLDSAGDAIDSNGSVEITGGTVLVNGPSSDGDGAFDYDSEATVSGGTVLMIGSSRMAQSFSSGTQLFLYTANVSGSAGETVAIVDANGNVIASMTATKQFGMVLASSPKFTEGGEYSLVIGGVLTNVDAHGYTDSGTVSGGSSISATASTTPSSSVGGVGSGPGARGR